MKLNTYLLLLVIFAVIASANPLNKTVLNLVKDKCPITHTDSCCYKYGKGCYTDIAGYAWGNDCNLCLLVLNVMILMFLLLLYLVLAEIILETTSGNILNPVVVLMDVTAVKNPTVEDNMNGQIGVNPNSTIKRKMKL
ncbi:hypothetical protein Glove_64g55 [Diversispora epigaea]|uniref:Uncharacterized protein n=1 Tax=Diversispora epigaea TaxID=1348612 RepID=A0A397JB37_9GLOM|nr:hypothetical protein Glove_64g55 [Diversispora epigaea]